MEATVARRRPVMLSSGGRGRSRGASSLRRGSRRVGIPPVYTSPASPWSPPGTSLVRPVVLWRDSGGRADRAVDKRWRRTWRWAPSLRVATVGRTAKPPRAASRKSRVRLLARRCLRGECCEPLLPHAPVPHASSAVTRSLSIFTRTSAPLTSLWLAMQSTEGFGGACCSGLSWRAVFLHAEPPHFRPDLVPGAARSAGVTLWLSMLPDR